MTDPTNDDPAYLELDQLDGDDFELLGRAVWGYVAASLALGHANPSSSYMYIDPGPAPMTQLAKDILTGCAQLGDPATEARAHVRALFDRLNMLDHIADVVTR